MVVQMVVMVMVMDGKVKDEEHQDTIGKKWQVHTSSYHNLPEVGRRLEIDVFFGKNAEEGNIGGCTYIVIHIWEILVWNMN